ncbi:hypothetical protein VNI00_018998 [Paramarasmius palmivorus]|uniref:Nephrocystin 3-like N-terminal domain-containing protein n=1 Tax=Paramarasmius palmivorus TaxID=297713 RepID=A0AAW0ATT8_9AGAR
MALNNASDFTVNGGAYNHVNGTQYNIQNMRHSKPTDDALQILAQHAAMNATYDSDPVLALNCHPNTRIQTLKALNKWVTKRNPNTRVQWISGSAGVGKSAIAQKVTEDHRNRIFGAFFFSRNDSTRDGLDSFAATVAYQCCTSDQLGKIVGPLILDAIQSNPNVFKTPPKTQFRKLILEPFSKVKRFQRQKLANLLVIDGLDECVGHSSQQTLLEIVDLSITFRTPIPLIFLLSSRPEPQIRHAIASAGFASCLEHIEIPETTVRFTGELSESDRDIQKYFSENFANLREKYRRVLRDEGETWPGHANMKDLVERASGQFIFAVTVINYIDTLDERPQDRLKTILDRKPGEAQGSPYPALDMLYRQILSTCRNWDKVSLILRLLVTPHPDVVDTSLKRIPWNSTVNIAGFLKVKPGDVEILGPKNFRIFSDGHAAARGPSELPRNREALIRICEVPEDAESNIRILHASFTDFLLDRTRSLQHCITPYSATEYCNLIADLLLRTLSSYTGCYPSEPYRSTQSFDAAFVSWPEKAVGIASHPLPLAYWPSYCYETEYPDASLLAELDGYNPYFVSAVYLRYMHCIPTFLFSEWRSCLTWAKSLGPEGFTPRIFTQTMESFFSGFYMGYCKETWRLQAMWGTFEVECRLTKGDVWDILVAITGYYKSWWTERLISNNFYPLMLPSTSDPSRIFPEDWVVFQVKASNADLLKRVHGIRMSLSEGGLKDFDDDVIYDTSVCVVQKLVEEEDLDQFKAMLYERRDLFAHLATKQHELTAPAPGEGLENRRNADPPARPLIPIIGRG